MKKNYGIFIYIYKSHLSMTKKLKKKNGHVVWARKCMVPFWVAEFVDLSCDAGGWSAVGVGVGGGGNDAGDGDGDGDVVGASAVTS